MIKLNNYLGRCEDLQSIRVTPACSADRHYCLETALASRFLRLFASATRSFCATWPSVWRSSLSILHSTYPLQQQITADSLPRDQRSSSPASFACYLMPGGDFAVGFSRSQPLFLRLVATTRMHTYYRSKLTWLLTWNCCFCFFI
jgi:hypothetical protein